MLTIRNKCETPVATFSQDVVINDVPPDPSMGIAICAGGALLDANPQDLPDFDYVWSTGDSTETIVNAVRLVRSNWRNRIKQGLER